MKRYPLESMPKQYGGHDAAKRRQNVEFNNHVGKVVAYLNSQMLASDSKIREFGAFEIGRILKIDTEMVSDVLCYLGAGTNGIIIEK